MTLDAPTASIIVALIVAAGVAFNTWLSARSLVASNKNAAAIAEAKAVAIVTAAEVKEIKVSVDGNLKKLLATMEEKADAEKKLEYLAGASDQRASPDGTSVVAVIKPAAENLTGALKEAAEATDANTAAIHANTEVAKTTKGPPG